MLELKNITKVYGKKAALQDVSVAFAPGQIVGLFGENGAGKTTLMKCILGLIGHKGEVTLDGEAIGCGNIARLSFATCEHSFFPRLSPKAHREFYREHFPRFNDKRFEALMDFFGLPMDKALRSYSVGMQNQFEVVLALSQGADYILMDEPFSAVDHLTKCTLQEELINIRQAENKTVLFVTHDINEAVFLADRVVLLSPRPSTIQKIYEIPLEQKRGRSDPLLLKIAAEIAKDINSGGQDIPNNYWGNL